MKTNENGGMYAAYVIGMVLFAAMCWMAPSAAYLFGIAALTGVALFGAVLLLACAIGVCESTIMRIRHKEHGKHGVKVGSRTVGV